MNIFGLRLTPNAHSGSDDVRKELAKDTKDIVTALNLFGQRGPSKSYFISQGLGIEQYPDRGFRTDFYIYAICISGEASLSLNGRRFDFKTNDFITAIPSTIVQIHGRTKDFKARILVFEKAFLLKNILDARQLEQLGFFGYHTFVHVCFTKTEIEMIKDKLDHILSRSSLDGIFQQAIIQSLIINLLFETAEIFFNYRNQISQKALSREEELFSKFVELVNKHFLHEHSLQFYADRLSISAKYLTKVCNNISGKPPGVLLAEQTLAEAKLLLANPDHNISMVSQRLNYADVAAFSKFFKKQSGLSPSSYRKSLYTIKQSFQDI